MSKLAAEHRLVNKLGKQITSTLLIVSLLGIVLSSCASLLSGHERFVLYNNSKVGRNFDKEDRGTSIQKYADSRALPNGNIEYGYKWRRTCYVYYEVDPETRIIVDWRWEGSQGYCVHGG